MAAHIDKDGGLRPVAPDPYTGTADCHGTCAAWYNIACSNILTAIDGDYGTVLTWRSEVNQNAYYFVEVVAESGPAQIDERQLFGEKKAFASNRRGLRRTNVF